MDEIDGSQEGMPLVIIRLGQVGDKIAAMDHACEFIEATFIDGQAGIVQFFDPLFELAKGEVESGAEDIEPGAHDLSDGDATEFDDAFQDVPFFFGGFVLGGFVDLIAKLFDNEAGFFATEEAFQTFRLADRPAADAAEEQVDEFDDAGGIVSELEVVLCGPDLWHHFTEQDHDEGDEDDLDQEFEEPEILFKQDHFIDKEVSQDDDRDIDDAIGDE